MAEIAHLTIVADANPAQIIAYTAALEKLQHTARATVSALGTVSAATNRASSSEEKAALSAMRLQIGQERLKQAQERTREASDKAALATERLHKAITGASTAADKGKKDFTDLFTNMLNARTGVEGLVGGLLRLGTGAYLIIRGMQTLANVVLAVPKAMYNAYVEVEKLQIYLEALTGSANAAQYAFIQIQELSRLKGIDTSSAQDVITRLKGFGVETSKLVPLMEKFNIATKGDNAAMERLALVFGQVMQQGRTFGDDIRQIFNAGIPIAKALADALGIPQEKLREAAREGKINASILEQALTDITAKGTSLREAFDRFADDSAQMKWKTAFASLGQAAASMGRGIAEATKGLATWIGDTSTLVLGRAERGRFLKNPDDPTIDLKAAIIAQQATVDSFAYLNRQRQTLLTELGLSADTPLGAFDTAPELSIWEAISLNLGLDEGDASAESKLREIDSRLKEPYALLERLKAALRKLEEEAENTANLADTAAGGVSEDLQRIIDDMTSSIYREQQIKLARPYYNPVDEITNIVEATKEKMYSMGIAAGGEDYNLVLRYAEAQIASRGESGIMTQAAETKPIVDRYSAALDKYRYAVDLAKGEPDSVEIEAAINDLSEPYYLGLITLTDIQNVAKALYKSAANDFSSVFPFGMSASGTGGFITTYRDPAFEFYPTYNLPELPNTLSEATLLDASMSRLGANISDDQLMLNEEIRNITELVAKAKELKLPTQNYENILLGLTRSKVEFSQKVARNVVVSPAIGVEKLLGINYSELDAIDVQLNAFRNYKGETGKDYSGASNLEPMLERLRKARAEIVAHNNLIRVAGQDAAKTIEKIMEDELTFTNRRDLMTGLQAYVDSLSKTPELYAKNEKAIARFNKELVQNRNYINSIQMYGADAGKVMYEYMVSTEESLAKIASYRTVTGGAKYELGGQLFGSDSLDALKESEIALRRLFRVSEGPDVQKLIDDMAALNRQIDFLGTHSYKAWTQVQKLDSLFGITDKSKRTLSEDIVNILGEDTTEALMPLMEFFTSNAVGGMVALMQAAAGDTSSMESFFRSLLSQLPQMFVAAGLNAIINSDGNPVTIGIGIALLALGGVSVAVNSAMVGEPTYAKITGNPVYNAALGAAYTESSLSQYSGRVYNSPQIFTFAHGTGMFAEAGPEAIMPLTRTSTGKLGVEAVGGTPVNVQIINMSSGATVDEVKETTGPDGTKILQAIIRDRIRSEVAKMGADGSLAQAAAMKYGRRRVS